MTARRTNTLFIVIAATAGLVGLAMVGSLWVVLGARGAQADANGTAGYTTGDDLVVGGVGLALVALSIIAVVLLLIIRPGRTST